MRVVSFLLLLGAVYGQTKYCCFPDKWEANLDAMVGSSNDEGESTVVLSHSKMSVDFAGKRLHIDQKIETGNGTQAEELVLLQLYEQKVQYLVHNGTCTRSPLGDFGTRNCIPDNATLARTYTLGNNETLSLKEYTWQVDTVQGSVTVADQCVPVFAKQVGTLNGDNLFYAGSYNDLTAGVADPSIFDVPASCKSAQQVYAHSIYRRSIFH